MRRFELAVPWQDCTFLFRTYYVPMGHLRIVAGNELSCRRGCAPLRLQLRHLLHLELSVVLGEDGVLVVFYRWRRFLDY